MKPKLAKAVATPQGVHCYTANGTHTQLEYGRRPTLNTRGTAGDFPLRNPQVFRAATARLNCVLPASFAVA